MSSEPTNPLAPAPIDWTPPSAEMTFSQAAREFAEARAVGESGVARPPTNQEINDRLIQARGILGEDRFWQKAVPQQSAAERAEIETRESLGVRPNAQPTDFTLSLPVGVDPSAADMIKSALSALELAPVMGNFLGQKIADVGRRVNQMLTDQDRFDYANGEQRKIADWAEGHGWDLATRKAEVTKLLHDRKVDPLIAGIAVHDFEVFVRLAMHVDHLKTVRL